MHNEKLRRYYLKAYITEKITSYSCREYTFIVDVNATKLRSSKLLRSFPGKGGTGEHSNMR